MAEILDAGTISIRADIKEAQDFLMDLGYNRKSINKAILRSVGTGGRQAIRKNYKTVLKKHTGKLYKGITSYVYRNGTRVVFTDNVDSGKKTSKDGRIARYGFMLASGYSVESKNKKKPMRFMTADGKWVSTYGFRVEPRDWVEAPLQRYVSSGDCQLRIDKAFQKQIDKWEKKNGGVTA
jgi:hypothetical protein